MTDDNPDAAVLIIGNEILSGRTQDVNLQNIATKLKAVGVPVKEARVVPDVENEIVGALNDLRKKYAYVITTGGIGPTHDDITVEAVAAAFGVPVIEDPRARKLLAKHFGEENLTVARLRMARVPQGAELVNNPVSGAPGIRIGNVFCLAGVPSIMDGMMDEVVSAVRHGPAIYSLTASGFLAESVLAEDLRGLASRHPSVDIGSYPWLREDRFGTSLVVRGVDEKTVQIVADELLALFRSKGTEAVLSEA